jgi:hypothetical protein
LTPYQATDRRGRTVPVVPVPDPPDELTLGEFVVKQGQRLDHLANAFLGDPNGFWRIAELNGAVLPEALSEVETVKIPPKTR